MRRAKRSHHKRHYHNPYQLIFPRYLFVLLELPSDRGLIGIIKQYPGVKAFLGARPGREYPIAVNDKDVDRLQQLSSELCKEPVVLPNGKPTPLKPQTLVRILFGPLEGLIAKVEIDNGVRADLLLAAAGVASKVNLPRELIEEVGP